MALNRKYLRGPILEAAFDQGLLPGADSLNCSRLGLQRHFKHSVQVRELCKVRVPGTYKEKLPSGSFSLYQ
jgi:hypothetical protein